MKARRTIKKMSIRAAAAKGGVGPTTWADLEVGRYPPSPATQLSVAISLDWPDAWYDQLREGANWTAIPDRDSLLAINQLDELLDRLERQAQALRAVLRVVRRLEALGVNVSELPHEDELSPQVAR